MENGVVAVLPCLVEESGARRARIVDEATAAALHAALHPRGRRQQVRPEPVDERGVARAALVGTRQHDEQWSRVDSTVILAKRDLLQSRHLTAAHLVQDLAGL